MASTAKAKFEVISARANLLSTQAGQLRRKADKPTKVVLLHAALATQVAAWEVYVKSVVSEYFSVISRTTDPAYSAMHLLLKQKMDDAAKKLNTPNSEKSRNFFMEFSGFDPWSHWVNVRFGANRFTSSLLTRERLNEIFAVRHSFAHGLTIPAYSWNTSLSGTAHLECSILKNTGQFLNDICVNTDIALSGHISSQHIIARPW